MTEAGFKYDWFSGNAREWPRLLAGFAGKPGLNFLEIGSFEGRSACWLVRHILTDASSHLTCIDLFPDALGGDCEDMPRRATPNASFDANIAALGASARVTKLRGASGELLRQQPIAAFDFIYIDGAHEAPHVLQDAVLAWPLLKQGGLMIFDDYGWGPELPALERPQPALDAFLSIYGQMLEVVDRGYQLTVRKTAGFPEQA